MFAPPCMSSSATQWRDKCGAAPSRRRPGETTCRIAIYHCSPSRPLPRILGHYRFPSSYAVSSAPRKTLRSPHPERYDTKDRYSVSPRAPQLDYFSPSTVSLSLARSLHSQATAATEGVQIATIVSGGGSSRSGEPTAAVTAVENPHATNGGSNGGGSGKAAPKKKLGMIRAGGRKGSVIPVALYRQANARYTLVYSHGNATDIGAMHDRCAGIAEAVGVNVLVYDYTGYGCARYDDGGGACGVVVAWFCLSCVIGCLFFLVQFSGVLFSETIRVETRDVVRCFGPRDTACTAVSRSVLFNFYAYR